MNYPAMRYVAEVCKVQGAKRAILWAISYRADRDTGDCWAGQRRIAREAGVSRKSVERLLPELLGDGELELVELGSGPRPDCYRIPVDNSDASGDTMSPVTESHDSLVATSVVRSGDIGAPLVATSTLPSGDMKSRLPAQTAPKGFDVLEAREEQGRNAAGSAADAAVGVAGGVSPDLEAAIRQLDPDVIRDPGGWNLSDTAPGGRGWLRDGDAARWVEQQQRGAAS